MVAETSQNCNQGPQGKDARPSQTGRRPLFWQPPETTLWWAAHPSYTQMCEWACMHTQGVCAQVDNHTLMWPAPAHMQPYPPDSGVPLSGLTPVWLYLRVSPAGHRQGDWTAVGPCGRQRGGEAGPAAVPAALLLPSDHTVC